MKAIMKSLTVISLLVTSAAWADEKLEIYVSPDSLANGNGTKETPFATLEEARDWARTKEYPVTVYLRGGTYILDNTFELDQRDSNVTYKACPGEKPIISGGKTITGWKEHENGIWKAKTDFNFRQLYVNDKRAVRARTPNKDFYQILSWDLKNKTICVPAECIKQWNNFDKIEMFIQQVWAESILRLDSFSVEGDTATITVQNPERDILFARPYPRKIKKLSFHFENAYEFLDQPGEWYLDQEENTVYYKPQIGENMETASVIAPYTETLVSIKETLDQPVENVTFEGIRFEYTTWMLPGKTGLLDMQAGMYNVNADKKNNQYVDRQKSAMYVAAAKNITIKNNFFQHIGACAIDLHYGTSKCNVVGNVLEDISGNGIQHAVFSEPDVESHVVYNPKDQREICRQDSICNNYLNGVGVVYLGSVGIAAGWPQELTIEHNEIANAPYSGISVGWGWNNKESAMKGNKIRYNHIHHVMQTLSDGGAIYTISPQPGSEISYNYIHDIAPSKEVVEGRLKGIYFDECSDGFETHHNVIYDAPYPIFKHNVGPNIILHNNFIWITEGVNEYWREGNNKYPGKLEDIKKAAGVQPEYKHMK